MVKSSANEIVQSGKSEGGTIRVCDIGWQGYSLTVGAELCGRTTIDKLELHWGKRRIFASSISLAMPILASSVVESCFGR
jgi:hypothetical protein